MVRTKTTVRVVQPERPASKLLALLGDVTQAKLAFFSECADVLDRANRGEFDKLSERYRLKLEDEAGIIWRADAAITADSRAGPGPLLDAVLTVHVLPPQVSGCGNISGCGNTQYSSDETRAAFITASSSTHDCTCGCLHT